MFNINKNSDILLISMPWAWAQWPSIQHGILHSLLISKGNSVATLSAHLLFCEYLMKAKAIASWDEYNAMTYEVVGPEWVFTRQFFHGSCPNEEAFLKNHWGKKFQKMKTIKKHAKIFLEALCEEILINGPKIIVFSISNISQQLISSLVLSRMIKSKNDEVVIIFCGDRVENVVGASIVDNFKEVDFVIHGDPEPVISELIDGVFNNNNCSHLDGIFYRKSIFKLGNEMKRNVADLNNIPLPNYDEYFTLMRSLNLPEIIMDAISIPFESSRGCWWGHHSPCRFCALSDRGQYRSKPWTQTIADIQTLSNKYEHYRLNSVDNIFDNKYHNEFFNNFDTQNFHLKLFFEVKSNIGLRELMNFKQIGTQDLQPGIESLSTEILQLMGKGVTAIQNLRFLKFCAWVGINPKWNLLYGFPGEPPDEYEKMAKLVNQIVHFSPCNFSSIILMRDSLYFQAPEKYGIHITGVHPLYNKIYPLFPEELYKIANIFDYTASGIDKKEIYTTSLRKAIGRWNILHDQAIGTLVYINIGNRIVITDKRPTMTPASYDLGMIESYIYKKCIDIINIQEIIDDPYVISSGIFASDVESFCCSLIDTGLLYREGDELLGLAIPYKRAEDMVPL